MEKRRLGKTEMIVSRAAFGGLFVASFATELEEAKRAVRRGLELGINYVDTAPGYHNSEEVLGLALEGITTPYYLSTKLGGRPKPFDPKNPEHLWFSLRESLRLLKRDYVDILLIHEPDRPGQYDWWDSWDTFHGPVSDFLEEVKAKGLVRYTGLGGTTAYEMARIIEKTNYDVVLTAFNYSLLWREAAIAVIPAAKKKGMGVIAGSPLQQGWLARRFDDIVRDRPPAWLSPQRREQLLRLYAYVDQLGMTLPELALRFVISNPDIDTMLMGLRSVQEVEQNVAAVEKGPLPADVLAELEDIYRMVPFRPFEEPFGCMLGRESYRGPGVA
jgi:aryl-alcohol dehydrogenase-like predicted oxidoreductase